jgi:hypothetical protein
LSTTTTYIRWSSIETMAVIPALVTASAIRGGTVSGPKMKSWTAARRAKSVVMTTSPVS